MATANPFMEDIVEMGIFMPYGIEQLFLGTVSAKIIGKSNVDHLDRGAAIGAAAAAQAQGPGHFC